MSNTPNSAPATNIRSSDDNSPAPQLNIQDILNILPHRYPFLLIDRITDATEKSVTGLKSVTMNEWFFQGHFPEKPVMPGVLILEAMAQTGAVMVHQWEENKGKLVFLAGVDEAKFRRLVQPGDQLRIEVIQTYRRRGVGRSQCKAYVGDDVVCEAILTFMAER